MYCKKCGTQMPDDAMFCPSCGEPTPNNTTTTISPLAPKKKKSHKILIIIAAVLGFFFIVGSFSNHSKPKDKPSQTTAVSEQAETIPQKDTTKNEEKPVNKSEFDNMMENCITVSWRDVYDAYKDNPIAADELYRDKILKMSGNVTDIGREILQHPYIEFGDNVFAQVRIDFNKSEEKKVAQLKKGDVVTIVGKCSGWMITESVQMLNCYFAY